MKPKKLNKKLSINRITIANLSGGEQEEIRGGYLITECTACETWCNAHTCFTRPQVCGFTPDFTEKSCIPFSLIETCIYPC